MAVTAIIKCNMPRSYSNHR